jgi:hypothetical protein
MSQSPPFPQDPGSAMPYDPYAMQGNPLAPAAAKPGGVTALAVLAIVFGGLGSLCEGFGTIAGLIQLAGVDLFSGLAGAMNITPALKVFGVVDSVINLLLYLTLLIIGIAALSLKPWSRRIATSWWSVVMIVWAVVRLILKVAWIGPASLEAIKEMQQSNPNVTPEQMHTILSAAMVGGAILAFLIQLLLPVLFLLLWRGKRVIGAFEPSVPRGTAGAPGPNGA